MSLAYGGTKRLNTSGAVGESGKPVRVYRIDSPSTSNATVLDFYNSANASSAADLFIHEIGSANVAASLDFSPIGILFSKGCYYNHNIHNSFVAVTYKTEL